MSCEKESDRIAFYLTGLVAFILLGRIYLGLLTVCPFGAPAPVGLHCRVVRLPRPFSFARRVRSVARESGLTQWCV